MNSDRMFRGTATVHSFVADVAAEVERARDLFPEPAGLHAAFAEEAGEVAKALLDEDWAHVYAEAVQAAAMCCRLALEGDPTLDELRRARGLQDGAKASS